MNDLDDLLNQGEPKEEKDTRRNNSPDSLGDRKTGGEKDGSQ